ncbi:hypothetical protein [Nocardioides bruguierae]|uniref:hypothetical protein n=1 Tax=Nocardioides bruguierae TaxID=2945102 RepID=UPI00202086AB|nr:hypothetical protein [Nocardioides bruguierae]MCL8026325.1 hypothetical protein [Nocardioides bruguierae]
MPELPPDVEVAALREDLALVSEALVDLELEAADRGWQVASRAQELEFTRAGLDDVARNCSLMALASPLVKRGVLLRTGYVWGQGVTITARANADADQDVNAVVQAFLDDPANAAALFSADAQASLERQVATAGNQILALFPDPLTGSVQVRTVPFAEVRERVTNPQDRADTWFYLRSFAATVVEPGYLPGSTRRRQETRRVLHPALGYWPRVRPRTIDGIPVLWDQPILHVAVNRPEGADWGVPDVYAALPWARAYEGFLTDWAKLVKALSKFAWRLSGDRASKASRAAARMAQGLQTAVGAGPVSDPTGTGGVGMVAAGGPGVDLEAIPKTGATVDSGSGRPLASMAAAGLGVSMVDLLADPGVTGARAVAETMDKPVVLEMGMRRRVWAGVIQQVLAYVIDQAVKAPRGPLRGSIARDVITGRETVTLAGDVDRTVTVDWPALDDLDPLKLVEAIVAADGTGKMWPPETARLLMQTLGVEDVDEVLALMTDNQGRWIDPEMSAGQAAADAFRRGDDPAAVA